MPTGREYSESRKRPSPHSNARGDDANRGEPRGPRRKRPSLSVASAASAAAEAERKMMTGFAFDAIRFDEETYCSGFGIAPQRPFAGQAVRIPDPRNFISPPWPRRFWANPVFTRDDGDLEARLAATAARNAAAAAAIDNLRAAVDGTVEATIRRLDPLESRVVETAEALADLERAAAAAEEADAAAAPASSTAPSARPSDRTESRADDGLDATGEEPVREVQVVKNDPKLRYDVNLAVDMLLVVYAARGASGSSGVSMGTWYRTMQDTVVAERPVAARRIDSQNGRMSRTFVAAVVASMQSCGRSYVGSRQYSAFESAALCMYVYSAATSGAASSRPPSSFGGLLTELPTYLDELADALSTSGGRPRYAFESNSLPKGTFAAPGGGRYERDALAGHSVLAAFTTSRALPVPPGAIPKEGVAEEVDAAGTAYDDRVNRAAAALLGRAQTLFLMEDQTLLRAAVDTVTALLLLRRLLWNTNVYADRTLNAFQLGSLLPTGSSGGAAAQVAVGASAMGPKDSIKSDGRNFAFLLRNYVIPLYDNDRTIEITQMFPGLVAVCLEAAAGGLTSQTRGTRRRVLDVSAGRSQAALVKLVGLELENRGKNANVVSVREVIATHDTVVLQYERGLGAAMQTLRLRETLFESNKAAAFNVSSDYDLHYFLCLGYLPKFTSAV